jgi:hypothetical protein
MGVFMSHPKLQRLPALLEVPGKDGHGPDADEVRKLKELHARWTRRGRGSASTARTHGMSARRSAARRTRG